MARRSPVRRGAPVTRRLDLTDVPCDKTTARRVMMLAYEAGDDADIRAEMARVVEMAVRREVERREVAAIEGGEERARATAALVLRGLSDRAVEQVVRLGNERLREAYGDVLDRPEMAGLRALVGDRPIADGTEPGTATVSPDGGEWQWRDRGPRR